MLKGSLKMLLVALAGVVVFVFAGCGCAWGASAWWHVASGSRPSVLRPGVNGEIFAKVYNLGDASASGQINPSLLGSPVKISDVLPGGLKAVAVAGAIPFGSEQTPIPCVVESVSLVSCSFEGVLGPYGAIEVRIAVEVGASVAGENEVSVSGGETRACEPVAGTGRYKNVGCLEEAEGGNFEARSGGPITGASVTRLVTVGVGETPFGVEDYEMSDEEEGGGDDRQAGSHQFQSTFSLDLNAGPDQTPPVNGEETRPRTDPAALAKDLNFPLPPGWIGNPTAFPRCSIGDFLKKITDVANSCPADTAMGVVTVTALEPKLGTFTERVPLFNLEPRPGEPARFGFYVPIAGAGVYIDASVRTGSDYGVTGHVENITQIAGFLSSEVSLWGVPGDPRHNISRGWGCLYDSEGLNHESEGVPCLLANEQQPPAFLSLPTSCTGELHASVSGDSWLEPENDHQLTETVLPGLRGCNRLPFSPSIKIVPDGQAASSSSGVRVDVHVPQEETLNATGLAESDAKAITVALPAGVTINPSGSDGLQACPESLIGFQHYEELQSLPGTQSAIFTSTLPQPLAPGANFCPDAAKIGTVNIKTPLLLNPLEGAVYLATQNENPFGSLIAVYLVAQDPISGVLVKVTGQVHLDPQTGQIVTTFENSPQLPFEDAEVEFFGGERAPLATPAHCGAYTTTASIAPWSGNEPVTSSSTFQITSGPNGSSCPGTPLPFNPSLTGGATNLNAGLYSPLTGTYSRQDGEQNIVAVQLHLPGGLSAALSGVKLCPEEQANAGTCTTQSLIGETTVSAGVGSDPVSVKGGRIYLTEKYHGAPFGLSVVEPVKAGPFDLERDTSNPSQNPACDCIVVRAKLDINPITTQVTITTNSPSEGYAIPSRIDGIPVQLKRVNFTTTRTAFQFNPTNCQKMAITGTATTSENTTQNVQVPFQVTNCALLAFTPTFQAYTTGKTSKTNGASLTLKVTRPSGPESGQANFAKAKIDIPKQLPSRLTTLQKACLAIVFETNPAACPPASIVGHAIVITPALPVPLEGPAYFVSHGNEAFPSLTMILGGYGITLQVTSNTFIKNGITSGTLNNVPDQPFTTFELTLPQGKYSALAANTNLCTTKLTMPTAFTAQNGIQIHTTTPIHVTGCHTTHKPTHTNCHKHNHKTTCTQHTKKLTHTKKHKHT
jgi:hypothetical protein